MIERALVVGLGSIGARHLRLLREALPQADIRVLRHSGCSGEIPHANGCFDRLEEACAFMPQAAVVSNPAPFHLATARALAEIGTHLLIEKPLADMPGGIADLLRLCSKQAQVVQVGYNLRMLETLQRFRAELQAGRIGPVQSVRCEIGQYLPAWRPGTDYRFGVSARRDLGGGVLLELSHELDMLRWVFGEVDWISAWTGQQGNFEIDVEDSAHITLGFSEGAVGQLSMDFLRRDTTRICTAIAERGTLRWNAVTGELALYDPMTNGWELLMAKQPDRDASYRAQISLFLQAITCGSAVDPVASGVDGLAVLQMIDAARASVFSKGKCVAVDRAGRI